MKEYPILFNGPMVRAILEGRKTQTRRIAKLDASGRVRRGKKNWHCDDPEALLACPYQPGDRLWVRETFALHASKDGKTYYRADGELGSLVNLKDDRWIPSIHMPRQASRITLEVTSVRVEHLQDITEEDAFSEGTPGAWCESGDGGPLHRNSNYPASPNLPTFFFRHLWEQLYGKGSWDANPWVWACEFRRIA